MVARTRQIKVGDPLDENTQMGALISKEHMEKVQSYIEIGKNEGKLLTGGDRPKDLMHGNFCNRQSSLIYRSIPNSARKRYSDRLCRSFLSTRKRK